MSMTFNMVGGGGSGIPGNRAVLVARIPSGSTVTATKGGVTLTPMMWVSETYPDQDIALFVFTPAQFDSVNPWTITATDGTNTASETVLITTNKEYEITITFIFYIYKDGVCYNGFDPTTTYGNAGFVVTPGATTLELNASSNGRCAVVWNLPFDSSKFTTLTAVIESGVVIDIGGVNSPYFGMWSGSGQMYDVANWPYKTLISTTLPTTVTVDVTNASGYIGFRLLGNSSSASGHSDIFVKELYILPSE